MEGGMPKLDSISDTFVRATVRFAHRKMKTAIAAITMVCTMRM